MYCEIRPDYATEDFIRFLPLYSNDPYALVGVETGSQRMLDYLQKDLTLELLIDAFKIFNKYKVGTSASFIIGLPHETKEDVKQTLQFVSKLKPTRYTTCIYVPFPGSPLYNQIVQEGLFKPPESTEQWGRLASEENANINVSEIDSEFLENINKKMYVKSVWTFLKRGRIKGIFIGVHNLLDNIIQQLKYKRILK